MPGVIFLSFFMSFLAHFPFLFLLFLKSTVFSSSFYCFLVLSISTSYMDLAQVEPMLFENRTRQDRS